MEGVAREFRGERYDVSHKEDASLFVYSFHVNIAGECTGSLARTVFVYTTDGGREPLERADLVLL